MPSITALVHEKEAATRRLERIRDTQETREDMGTTILAAVGARVGLKIVTAFVPSIASMIPVIEVAGAALLLKRAFDLEDTSARDLGIGIGLGMGAADRLADFLLTAINKFKTK